MIIRLLAQAIRYEIGMGVSLGIVDGFVAGEKARVSGITEPEKLIDFLRTTIEERIASIGPPPPSFDLTQLLPNVVTRSQQGPKQDLESGPPLHRGPGRPRKYPEISSDNGEQGQQQP